MLRIIAFRVRDLCYVSAGPTWVGIGLGSWMIRGLRVLVKDCIETVLKTALGSVPACQKHVLAVTAKPLCGMYTVRIFTR